MKALLAVILLFALAEPASACRHYSIWRYDFPQPPCPRASPETQAGPARTAPDIPLPALTEINWGKPATGGWPRSERCAR